MMIHHRYHVSVSRARWQHIDFNTVFELRQRLANENEAKPAERSATHSVRTMTQVGEPALVEE